MIFSKSAHYFYDLKNKRSEELDQKIFDMSSAQGISHVLRKDNPILRDQSDKARADAERETSEKSVMQGCIR